MVYIDLQNDLPGLRDPLAYSPETGKPRNELTAVLLHHEINTLSRGARELIGADISSENDCLFTSHYILFASCGLWSQIHCIK